MSNFKFQSQAAHFTYKTHIDHNIILQLFETLKPNGSTIEWYSIVWEAPHNTDDAAQQAATPYAHTHAAVRFSKRPNKRGANFADLTIDGVVIHPHVQPIGQKQHAIRIYNIYHKKAPIQLWQSDRAPATQTTIEAINEAASLYDACTSAGIVPKTVGDINLLRKDRPRPPPYKHNHPGAVWLLPLTNNFHTLYVWGGTGTGKTQWAIHCFNAPLLVRTLDKLRDFDPAVHDGIVFDDVHFAGGPAQLDLTQCIHLLDWEEESTLKIRYYDGCIPRHTKKIFTSNAPFQATFPTDTYGALRRRLTRIIHVTGPTFAAPAAAVPADDDEDDEDDSIDLAMVFDREPIGDGHIPMGFLPDPAVIADDANSLDELFAVPQLAPHQDAQLDVDDIDREELEDILSVMSDW